MNRLRFFVISDGIFILVGGAFLYWIWSRRNQSQFKDDLWEQVRAKYEAKEAAAAPKNAKRLSHAQEDKIDQKILLEDKTERKPSSSSGGRSTAEAAGNPQGLQFRPPNFRGKAHEVLGISADSDGETVDKAYKFWIKKYHPDRVTHLGGQYIEQARRRSEQLNAARQHLLSVLKAKRI